MATDPRSALTTLVTALERHLEACASRTGEEDPRVIAAYNDLADAFEDYDDALLEAHGEVTPFEVYSDEDDDSGDDDAGTGSSGPETPGVVQTDGGAMGGSILAAAALLMALLGGGVLALRLRSARRH